MDKDKNAASHLKKLTTNMETARKNIESGNNLIENIHNSKSSFN